jgi:hypothetical protein
MMRLAICPATFSLWLVGPKFKLNPPCSRSGTRIVPCTDSIVGLLLVVQQRRGHRAMARRRVQPSVNQGINTGVHSPPSKRGRRLLFRLVFIRSLNEVTEHSILGWQNNWTVFLGSCTIGSVLCKSIWKTLVRIEGVTVFLIGIVV